MTDSEGGSGNPSGDDETSSNPSSKAGAGSRFDQFHERLDERDSKRESSNEGEQDSEEADGQSTVDPEPTDPDVTTGREAESGDGWVWGSSKGTTGADDAGPSNAVGPSVPTERKSETASEESDETETDPVSDTAPRTESETVDGRIWDEGSPDEISAVTEQAFDRPIEPETPDDTPPDGDSGDPTDDRAKPTSDDRSTGTAEIEPSTEQESTEDGSSGSIESDRWSEIESDLRSGDGHGGTEPAAAEPRSKTPTQTAAVEEDKPRWSGEGSVDDPDGVADTHPGELGTPDSGFSDEVGRAVARDSVLVLGPTGHSVSDVICSKFLTGDEGARDVIFVTFDGSAEDRIDICHRNDEWTGGEIGVIQAGRSGRNVAASEITGGENVGSITVKHVSKPGDLSKLGMVITQLLSKFNGTSRRTVLCVHTLSALHNQVGTKTLFRFLNTLQGRLRSENAVGHYHMNPELHDEIVIETIRPIFDSVIRFSADGTLDVE